MENVEFCVWAPLAESVEVILKDNRQPRLSEKR